MRIQSTIIYSFALLLSFQMSAQNDTLYLTNPSFEDIPRHSSPPRGWLDCGFEGESDVDVHPSGTFSVVKAAKHGNTYLGMVVRDNDTWERVSQPLSSPMVAGQCYEFSIFLARSETYISVSKLTEDRANYDTAAKLRIFGGFAGCDRSVMLEETNVITHTRWIQYVFKLEPQQNFTHIILEAFYHTPTLFPYNGNILLDHASTLAPVPCDEEEEVVEDETPEPVATPEPADTPAQSVVKTPVDPVPQPVETTPETTPQVAETAPIAAEKKELIEEVAFDEIKKEEIKKGTIIRTNQIYFAADKATIQKNSYEAIDGLYTFLSSNQDVTIEVGGHTNSLPAPRYCDSLSTVRAKSVVDYLYRKGIPRNRLSYKGYGKRQLIASDETLEGRRKNQRVEIKILSVDEGE